MLIADTWFIYLLRCRRGRFYTGITTDVSRRLAAHADGRGSRSLRGQAPLVLLYCAQVGDRSRALRLEYRIKQLARQDKARLVKGELALEQILIGSAGNAGGVGDIEREVGNRLSVEGHAQV